MSEQEYQRQQIARLTQQAQNQSPYPEVAAGSYQEQAQIGQGPLTYAPVPGSKSVRWAGAVFRSVWSICALCSSRREFGVHADTCAGAAG